MKKRCPYCNSGELTVKNTYDDVTLGEAYPPYLKAFSEVRKFNPKATFFRRYYCDVCQEYIWSYEEIIHKVPARQIGIRTPKDNTVYMYNDGKQVGRVPANVYTQGTMEKKVNAMTEGTSDEEKDSILDQIRNLE